MSPCVQDLVARLAAVLTGRSLRLCVAESCTGGLIGSTLTDRPGSSAWFLGGVVAYANSAKRDLLQVPETVLLSDGAVSQAAVLAMAKGAVPLFGAEAALAVSGIAGPEGGTRDKPVGTVWMAWVGPFGEGSERFLFSGDRLAIKGQTVQMALEGLLARLGAA